MRRLLLYLLASGLPVACLSAPPDNGGQAFQSERWATPIKHDANLYRIDDKLYRSEQPVAEDGEAIVKLGIQSVINLRFFDRNDDDHLKAYGLTLLNRPLLSWSIKPKEIAEILYLIEKQQQNGAVLILLLSRCRPYRFDCWNVPHHLSRLAGGRSKSRNATWALRLSQHLEKHCQPVYRRESQAG